MPVVETKGGEGLLYTSALNRFVHPWRFKPLSDQLRGGNP